MHFHVFCFKNLFHYNITTGYFTMQIFSVVLMSILNVIATTARISVPPVTNSTTTNNNGVINLGKNLDKILALTKGKSFIGKLSPCAGPYSDCCRPGPDYFTTKDATSFVFPSYLTQYFYICIPSDNGNVLYKLFRCPYNYVEDEYRDGIFTIDDQLGCHLGQSERRKKKTQPVETGDVEGAS